MLPLLYILGALAVLVLSTVLFFLWYIRTPSGDRLLSGGGGTPETFQATKPTVEKENENKQAPP